MEDLALLLDLERANSILSDLEDWEDTDEALRCRCIRVGSISCTFASLANKERTAVVHSVF